MEFVVTAKVGLSIIADDRTEADSNALDYFLGIMGITSAEILDIEEVPDHEDDDPVTPV